MGLTVHFEVLNQLGTPMMYSDTLANRPNAGITGRIFFRTDSPYGIFRDTGSAWDQISGASTFSGSLATGQVAFGSATNTISGTNNLFWDNANSRLGIGTNAPISTLHLSTNISGSNTNIALNSAVDSASGFQFISGGVNTSGSFFATGNAYTFGTYPANQINLIGGTGGVALRTNNAAPIRFYATNANASFSTVQLQMFAATGNLVLQNGGTFVDNGNRLQVYGNAFVSEAITARRTITSNGDSTDFGGFFYTNGFGVTTATIFSLNTPVSGGTINSNYALINDQNGLGSLTSATANYLQIASERNPGSGQIGATGIINFINIATRGISNLSGSSSVTYNAINVNYTINRSGAGIMRGFYYNPTITSLGGSVHNAIETTSGNVLFGTNFFWDNTNGSLGIGTNSIYTPTAFNLDVNGGLLIKNTAGRTAQLTLINANPALGGNNGFLVNTVGGTSGSSYVDFQGYYGTSITGSTALRLNPAGGPVIINSTTNSGEQVQITGTLRVNGQRSGSAGGNSGQHLIINCDGVSYKIALLNP